jgi:transcriptional regulator with XRE-family HTH domain
VTRRDTLPTVAPRPTFRRRRLARRLRQLRDDAEVSYDRVHDELGFSRAKLSRIESAEVGISVADCKSLARLYGVDEEEIDRLGRAARAVRERSWWYEYSGALAEAQADYLELEDEATSVDQFTIDVVPGLLQIEGYARALLAASSDIEPARADQLVQLRMQRQHRLQSGDLRVWAIMDEAVLRRPVGDLDVRRAQLEHLAREAENNSAVTLQIIPFEFGPHVAMGAPFYVLHGEYEPVAYTDTISGGIVLEDEASVSAYRAAFNQLRATAAGHRPSLGIIQKYLEELP